MSEPLIALLTDFGTEDTYVGVMKGAALRINPHIHFVDISHAVRPQSVRQAAFLLANACPYFPDGTIFLVVVDPGVGSSRKAVAVKAGAYYFVAPDNGVLCYTLDNLEMHEIIELTNPNYRHDPVSATFHGRDIFAPAAAYLASGVSIRDLGEALDEMVMLSQPILSLSKDGIVGEVVHIDWFGNIVSSIGHLSWESEKTIRFNLAFGADTGKTINIPSHSLVSIHGRSMSGIHHTYAEADFENAIALISSDGFLEIAVRSGNAAELLNAHIGDAIDVRFR